MMEKFRPIKQEVLADTPDSLQNLSENQPETQEQTLSSKTYDFYRTLLENKGFTEFNFVSEGYASLPDKEFIVRREDPKNVDTLFDNGSYSVDFHGNTRYSNCVSWKPSMGPRGIQNAYLEGYTHINNVVTVVGIKPDGSEDICQLADATSNFHGLERENVRSFQGVVSLQQVAFVSLRIPGHLLPHSELTEDEAYFVEEYEEAIENNEKPKPVMVHRLFVAPQK